jgi:CheY-like chemotaxis protein
MNAEHATMPKKKLNILLIDDDREEYNLFKEALQRTFVDFGLAYSADCLEGIYQLLDAGDFHIIFLDINMPGKNGLKFLKEIKQKEKYAHIPIVMYTTSGNEQDIDESYTSGAHYYMIKPYAQLNFVESLNKIFSIDWTLPQPIPGIYNFVINLAFA